MISVVEEFIFMPNFTMDDRTFLTQTWYFPFLDSIYNAVCINHLRGWYRQNLYECNGHRNVWCQLDTLTQLQVSIRITHLTIYDEIFKKTKKQKKTYDLIW